MLSYSWKYHFVHFVLSTEKKWIKTKNGKLKNISINNFFTNQSFEHISSSCLAYNSIVLFKFVKNMYKVQIQLDQISDLEWKDQILSNWSKFTKKTFDITKNRTFGTVTLENIEQNSKPQDKRQYKKSQNRGSAQNSHAHMHIWRCKNCMNNLLKSKTCIATKCSVPEGDLHCQCILSIFTSKPAPILCKHTCIC